MGRFEDKVVLVTGAGSGIGKGSALRIAAEGGSLFCVDLDAGTLAATVAEIAEAGGTATAHACDVSDEAQVIACVEACIEHYGSLYALINMAGILRFDDAREIELAQWRRVLDINLTGTMLLCREALPHLVKTGGSIVNAASTAALSGLPCGAAYCASKGGVLAMTRSIAVDFAKQGVRANCVCPGDINSGMTEGIDWPDTMDFELMPRIMSLSGPKGPEAIAGVIAMLASEDAIHITGEDVRVDGGTLS
ncbi:SDR family NAD(P)-dependent oxidoreductase [Parahaliea mediterranea]|uniref:SDR family oxidoreductase n=1 Tax=Parahaliea mediterranea TaxID=651086 RepID=A0A939DID9_9GAMM|nr:SDR family NAD(P)-dependent oxidoreductase [Parahaliea mediterranea]MBN7798890.1 SDR family oxidoreductase [Parahaliea mediterranea]